MGITKKYINKRWLFTIGVIILGVITWVLTLWGQNNPEKVEKLYSASVYPAISQKLSKISGLFPISIGEILVFSLLGIIVISFLIGLTRPRLVTANIKVILHIIVRLVGMAYILFYFMWGFNYYRPDYMTLAHINTEAASVEELAQLTRQVISQANQLRSRLKEDEEGVFLIEEDFATLGELAKEGFEDYYVGDQNLGGDYGRPKPLKVSKWMSYTGITGIYFPYTLEPNVNIDIPHMNIPVTMAHEMGHQRGFAREDEANFIGYKACVGNPSPEFQYSGNYLALQYLLSDLGKQDPGLYDEVRLELSDGVKRDMNYGYDYWKAREGKAEEVATTMNDNYLKANKQSSGVKSYNEVVKLLLAEFKSR